MKVISGQYILAFASTQGGGERNQNISHREGKLKEKAREKKKAKEKKGEEKIKKKKRE